MAHMNVIEISREMLDRYNRPGPRYTSYPTVPYWTTDFGEEQYQQALRDLGTLKDDALSVYVHLPFCAERCHYCGCNATVTNRPEVVDVYLNRVEREIDMAMGLVDKRRSVVQMHWGGGTPNFLTHAQMERLFGMLTKHLDIDWQEEIAIEIDPRIASKEQLQFIRNLGFNRISLGVQDFEPEVQHSIGRIQPEDMTKEFYYICRELGFTSVNVDLVYGLPGQSEFTFRRTLEEIIKMQPDRIACFSYAHLPKARNNQRQIDESLLPNHYEKFALFQMAIDGFCESGYDWIGIDHFARSDDELAVTARERRLHRNFMGYTIRPAPHQLAFGMSGISDLAGCFAQNDAKLGHYQKTLDAGHLPIVRGMRLSDDDKFRRRVILHLMCNLELPYELTTEEFGVSVQEAFSNELARLEPFEQEGFVVFEPDRLVVTTLGRYFLRNISMEFDSYLQKKQDRPLFSKTI